MPFNMAMTAIGSRRFILSISEEDLAINYNIASQIASQYPSAAPTRAGDIIQLNIAAVNLVSVSTYAIDGDGLHDDAILTINLASGVFIAGKGGLGGRGGNALSDPDLPKSFAGLNGSDGNTAIRLGCETHIIGTGTISKGYGGGGGGGGFANTSDDSSGGGGGGGIPLGGGGGPGTSILSGNNGSSGGAATLTTAGSGGAGGVGGGGAGGDGGDSSAAQQAGTNAGAAGGSAGADGNAIDSQGFTHSEAVGITLVGSII